MITDRQRKQLRELYYTLYDLVNDGANIDFINHDRAYEYSSGISIHSNSYSTVTDFFSVRLTTVK